MSKQIVLITGGNNGIGFETCARFAEAGLHVLMAARSLDKANSAIEQVKSRAPNATIDAVQLDVTSDASIAAAVKQVTDKHGVLDTLINNAGICPTEVSRELFQDTFNVNSTSPPLVTRAFVPLLRKSQSPRVIYVTSGLGSITSRAASSHDATGEDYRIYRMSKAALNMAVQCDAWEYRKDGVKVFTYCPGFVTSDLAGMRQKKMDMGVPGPEKSAEGLLAIHLGKQDENAGKYLNSKSVVDGGEQYQW